MSEISTYQALTDFAEGWGLYAMLAGFGVVALWPFRRVAREQNRDAAHMIFKDDNDE